LFSFIKKRFLHRFILVYHNNTNISIQIYDIKNQNIENQISEDFTLENKDEFTDEVVEFINTKQEEVSRSYIVTLVNSLGQGIVPTCSTSEFIKYSVDRRYTYNICVDGLFANYVSKIDINWIQKIFSKTGIDLIFSPFLLLKDIAIEDREMIETTLYILYIDHSASIMIKKDEKFLYGAFFNTTKEENPLYCDYEKDEEVDEDEFEIEDDIEIDIDEDELDLQDSLDDTVEEPDSIKDVELIEENKTFTKFLSNSLKEFYSNPIYDGNFIDRVKIYAEEDIDKSVIEFIENELFLSTEFNLVELDPIVLKYAQKEVLGV